MRYAHQDSVNQKLQFLVKTSKNNFMPSGAQVEPRLQEFHRNSIQKQCKLVIRGFLGSLNTNVMKVVVAETPGAQNGPSFLSLFSVFNKVYEHNVGTSRTTNNEILLRLPTNLD